MGTISSFRISSSGIMTGTLGLLLLLLPLAAPLIAQDTVKKENVLLETTECEFYNQTCANSEEGCPVVEKCNLSDQSSHAGCIVTWTNTTVDGLITINVGFKGCMYYDPSCTEKCVSHQTDKGNKSSQGSHYIYCCCLGNHCNSDFSWDPQENAVTTTTPPTRINTSSGVLQAVLLTLGVLVIIFILTPVIFYFYRRQKMANFMELPTVESTALTNSWALSHYNKMPVLLLEIKARGRFGAVWRAKYCNSDVAVKIFPVQDKESWMLERKIFSLPHMSHDNILTFIGFEERGEIDSSEFWLITAYHEYGSLYDYLKSHVLTWAEVCHIGEGLAHGLAYLHCEQPANKSEGLKPAIAHRDFKSKNVLLKSDLTACVADFGLALTFYPGQVIGETHGQVGTRRYMAPEVLEGAISFHRDAFLPIDMYACGLVLWEIVSRCSAQEGPVRDYKLPFEEDIGQHPTLDDMQECVVTKKIRPRIMNSWLSHSGLKAIIHMMQESWDHDAEARLSASCIVERFALLSRQPQLNHTSLSNKEASF